ncbi:SHOCT domain-containing protein [Streptomyces sp. NPDC058382]|uniref:SHOCT domain-containing protein n=1 Tax=unclassified Streptomyces TaxID=2593676 RepID=UPI003638339E
MNRRGPGLLGAVARTAVVAGTASAVSGRVQRHQQQAGSAGQDAEPGQPQAHEQDAEAAPDDVITQLERLAELRKQGILDDAEFAAQKKRILAD